MTRRPVPLCVLCLLLLNLTFLAGCGGSTIQVTPPALSAENVNLVFVVSEDLGHHGYGDLNESTANLTNQGLHRSLLMGTFLKQQVLGGNPVNSIYALEPMTHLQTANQYPDLVALTTVQQFAMLNQVSATINGNPPVAGNSFPIFASYSANATLPQHVAEPTFPCPGCDGLDFADQHGNNEILANGVIAAKAPGYYVFVAPWETISAMMLSVSQTHGYALPVPAGYVGPDYIYAISVAPAGNASLVTYNAKLNPSSNYPAPPAGTIASASCQGTYSTQVTGGVGGAVIPSDTNVNETVYMIRHAEAHPVANWDDGNYVAAGQWRALYLPIALSGKIHPDQVIAVDPAVGIPPTPDSVMSSYVRPAMTVAPYAIANHLPFKVAASVAVFSQNAPALATDASDYLFTNGTFSNQVLLVAWEHKHVPPTINALLSTYGVAQSAPDWDDADYDSIWTVKLDAQGNLTVDNLSCEGIDSSSLPATAPQY